MKTPSFENDFQADHARLLRSSFANLIKAELLPESTELSDVEFAQALFESPSVVVSHGIQDDPIFNYGNQAALELFDMDWDGFTQLPSRKSAEPLNREERDRLLAAVIQNGFIDDYSGIRVSSNGRRFHIPQAIVWNLVDQVGKYRGQAATFSDWRFV